MDTSKIVLVEVTGGVAEFVKVPDSITPYLIDWDVPEQGGCALCGEPMILDDCIEDGMHPPCRRTYEAILKG